MLANRLYRIHPFLIKKLPKAYLPRFASHGHDHSSEPMKVVTPEEYVDQKWMYGKTMEELYDNHYTIKGSDMIVDPMMNHEHTNFGPPSTLDYLPIPFKPWKQEYDFLNRKFNILMWTSTVAAVVITAYYHYAVDGFGWVENPNYVISYHKRGQPGYEMPFLKYEEWQKFMPEEYSEPHPKTIVYGEEETAEDEASEE